VTPGVRLKESAFPVWLRHLLPVVVLVLLPVMTLGPVKDPDTFWHLATGDWLRETWQFSGPDPWSASSTRTWTLHEWMPELVLSLFQQAFGLAGVAWLMPLGAACVTLCVLAACRARASLLVSSIVLVLAFMAMSASLSLRPHLVTFALTAVTISAWLRSVDDGRPRWWLIPVTWLWACSHGMWFIGVVIGVTTLLGLALDRRWSRRVWARLALVPFGSTVAALLTPVGPGLLMAPFEVRGYTKFVTEWAPPSLGDIQFIVLILMAVIPLLVWLRRGEPVSWSSILLLGLGVVVGLMYTRTMAVSAALIAPLTAGAMQQVIPLRTESVRRTELILRVIGLSVALALTAVLAPSAAAGPAVRVPNTLNEPLDAVPSGSVVCNAYRLGGWLIWRHPTLRPTIDGRTEIYSVDHVEAYINFERAAPGWESYVSHSGCTYALLSKDAAVVERLTDRLHWRQIASGEGTVLLRQP
jgi:hypothetical protein